MMALRDSIRNTPFSIREISETASQMDDVIRLDIGQPDFDTPENVKQYVKAVIDEDRATYTSLWGIEPLRDAIAAYEQDKFAVETDGVMVTTGGTGALHCLFTGLLAPHNNIVLNDPAWPPYLMIADVSPGTYRQVPYITDGAVNEDGIRNTIDEDTAALVLNTPENPTGRVYTKAQIKTIGGIAAEYGVPLIADEVYDHLVFEGEHVSPASLFPEHTIIVNSLSKNFAMTGWRLGWIATQDEELVHHLGKVNRASTACPNYLSQQAALYALRHEQGYAEEMCASYQKRRDLVMERVQQLEWESVTPHGALYAFPDVGQDSWPFARKLLEEAKVGVVPGAAAGSHSETNIRICFGSVNQEGINEAFDRIQTFLT